MSSVRLVIFDFSGTLSMGAVAFGQADRLTRHLGRWGLDTMGVVSAECYWQQIAGPTWDQASTTPVGYKTMMTDAVMGLSSSRQPRREVFRAVSGFVDTYLAASAIEPAWRPVLAAVLKTTGAVGVVATDHYAEATDAVTGHLQTLGIDAHPLGASESPLAGDTIAVACSADLGHLKSDPHFWKMIAGRLTSPVAAVMVVDDFGANEQSESDYTHDGKCEARRRRTTAILQRVFAAPVTEVVFRIRARDTAAAVADAGRQVLAFLGIIPGK